MNTCRLLVTCFVLSCLPVACYGQAQSFSRAMKTIFKGSQFKDFQWLEYPVDNFGVGTSYRTMASKAETRDFLCGPFTCFNISPLPGLDERAWLFVGPKGATDPKNGYAEEGCGGAIDTQLKQNSKLAISALLPKIYEIIGIDASFARDTSSTVEAEISSGCFRQLQIGKARSYIGSLQQDPLELRRSFDGDQLVLVAKDLVIKSFSMSITSSAKLKLAVDAKLQGAASKRFGDDAKIKVDLIRDRDGVYKVKSINPVIVGVLARKTGKSRGVVEKGWEGFVPALVPTEPKMPARPKIAR